MLLLQVLHKQGDVIFEMLVLVRQLTIDRVMNFKFFRKVEE